MKRPIGIATLAYLALALLTAAVYVPALWNPFAYDDIAAIEKNELIRDLRFVPAFFRGAPTLDGFAAGQFRPLVMVTFALNYAVGGANPFGFRLVNLVLHVVNVGLALLVLRRVLRAFPVGRGAPLDDKSAFRGAVIGAALLAAHPIHSLVVLQVWKRATALAALFALLATIAFMRLRGIGGAAAAARARVGWAALLYGGLALALASKEVAVAVPALLLLLELWPRAQGMGVGGGGQAPALLAPQGARGLEDGGGQAPALLAPQGARGLGRGARIRELAAWHAPLWALALGAVVLFYPHRSGGQVLAASSYFFTQLKVIWMYVAMAFAPPLLSASYHVEVARAPHALVVLAGVGLLGLAVAAVVLRRRAPLATLAVLWALVALGPTSSFFPIPLLVDEDRVYLSFLLPWGLVGAGVEHAHAALRERLQRPIVVVAGLVIVAVASFSLDRGLLWSSRPALWLDALKKHPASRPANENLCKALIGTGPPAAVACTMALERFPRSVIAREGVVRALIGVGRVSEAEKALREGLAMYPDEGLFHKLAGHLAWSRNQPADAVPHYRAAVKYAPWDQEALIYLGLCLTQAGGLDEARRIADGLERRAVTETAETRLVLAQLHLALGQRDRACATYAALRSSAGEDALERGGRQVMDRACSGR